MSGHIEIWESFSFILLIIFNAGYKNPTVVNQQDTHFLRNNSAEPTGLHKEALESLLPMAKEEAKMYNSAKKSESDLLFEIFIDADEYTIKSMPHFEVDLDKFMEDPKEEKILECLRTPENDVSFLVEAKTGELYHLMAHRDADEWLPSLTMQDLREKLSWLEHELKKADSEDYTLLFLYYNQFYILKFDGKPVFYNIFGKRMETEYILRYIVSMIKDREGMDNDAISVRINS